MKIAAIVRHKDGKKNTYEISNVESHEDARQALLAELGAKTTVLVLINSGKPQITEKASA